MRRLTRGRADTDDEASPYANGASEAVGDAAAPAGTAGPPPLGADPPTEVVGGDETATTDPGEAATTAGPHPALEAHRDLPAGVDPDTLAATAGGSVGRGRVRRRLRYLRAARELLLRDLGGFYYEAQRSPEGPDAHRRLLDVKARRLTRLDEEVRELEGRLSEPHPDAVVREPGIGGTCPECGELHGSDARFCPRCGTPLTGQSRRGAAAPAHPDPGDPVPEQGRPTTASLWGRRRTPAEAPRPEVTQAVADEEGGREESGREEGARGASGDGAPGAAGPVDGGSGRGARGDGRIGDDPQPAERPA